MKSLISIAVIFVCLSNFTGVRSARLFQESKHLQMFASGQAILHHQLMKRQTTDGSTATPEVMAQCTTQLSDILCTSGVAQRMIEADLSCGIYGIKEARKYGNMCAKSEDGQYCKSLLELYRIRQNNYVEGNCSRVLTLNSCPSACRTLLEEFRSELGCCINAYINGSTIFSPLYSSSLNYSVWNLCDVPLPPTDCAGNSPTISPPDSVQNCTSEDLFDKYYAQNLCLPEQRRLYTESFKRLSTSVCGTLIITPSYVKDLCSVNANGIPCGTLYYQSLSELSNLNSACSRSCTSDCRESISTALNRKGCCLSSVWFNLSYSALESCDIEPLKKCDAVLGSAVPIVQEKYTILILVIAGLLCSNLLV
jgi:hypothetical protein